MGALDSFVDLGAYLRGSIGDVFNLVLEQLPAALNRGERWMRQNTSEEVMTRDLFWRPVSGELKQQRDDSIPVLFGLSGTPFDLERASGDAEWSTDGAAPSGWDREHPATTSAEEQRILSILSENPDLLGRIIQREKRRGNPLFE